MLPAPLRLPRYLDACLTHLLPDAAAAVSGRPRHVVPLPDGLRAVVVLVVDGLGRRLLDTHRDLAPLLAAAPGTTLDAVFPATTTSNLTSLATGLTPRQHGMAGTVLTVDDRRIVPLTWTWDRLAHGDDARDAVPPRTQQPLPTWFERLPDEGVRVVTLFRPDHLRSGFTHAALRGGEPHAVGGLDATLATALRLAAERRVPTLVYAHHADIDTAGHLSGPGSARWCEALAAADAAIARAAEDLPADVALVVTADHGQVRVEQDDGLIQLLDHPELLDGVIVPAGDPRAPQLRVEAGAVDDVVTTWREWCGDLAEVRARDDAIAEGWFGPAEAAPGVLDDQRAGRPSRPAVIGDVIVAARGPVAWVHRDLDNRGGQMPGHHASLTADELEVPVVVLTR